MGLGTSSLDVAKLVAVVILGEPVGGDDSGDPSGVREEANRGSHRGHVLWPDCNGDRSGEFSLAGGRVGIEVSGRENADSAGISDRGSHAAEEILGVIRKIGHGEEVYRDMGLIWGESEG